MLVEDIVLQAATILGELEEMAPGSKKETALVDCVNATLAELTLEYTHQCHVEPLTFVDGRVYYSEFSELVREVLGVYTNGKRVSFEMYPLYLKANVEGVAEVRYLYHLGNLQKGDAVFLPPQYTTHLLAIGTVAEYAMRTGLHEEAAYYRSRYEAMVKNGSRRLRSASLPKRRFLL